MVLENNTEQDWEQQPPGTISCCVVGIVVVVAPARRVVEAVMMISGHKDKSRSRPSSTRNSRQVPCQGGGGDVRTLWPSVINFDQNSDVPLMDECGIGVVSDSDHFQRTRFEPVDFLSCAV